MLRGPELTIQDRESEYFAHDPGYLVAPQRVGCLHLGKNVRDRLHHGPGLTEGLELPGLEDVRLGVPSHAALP